MDAANPLVTLDVQPLSQPCPDRVPLAEGGASPGDDAETFDALVDIEPMLGQVMAYGHDRPATFGGAGLDWRNGDVASVMVSFTDDVDEHRRELEAVVEFPERLIVCQAAASEADRDRMIATLTAEFQDRVVGWSSDPFGGTVGVSVSPTDEELAAELVDRYGAAIEVRLGALSYPLSEAEPACGAAEQASLLPGLDARLVDSAPVTPEPSGFAQVAVELWNVGQTTIAFETGVPTARLTDPTGRPLSSDDIAVASIGMSVELEPGESQRFDATLWVAACDPSTGASLPPGDYLLVVRWELGGSGEPMYSPPLPVTIAAP